MKANVHPLDIVFRLAEDHGIVLLNGSGFAAPDWSVRISFANLDDHVYDDIGRAVRAIARGYRQAYEASMATEQHPPDGLRAGHRLRHARGTDDRPGRMTRSVRVLDPIDRVSEVLFGLIMVLTFTGSLSVAEAGRDDVRTMLIGALGCNLAWGIIDAVLYLMGCLAEKGQRPHDVTWPCAATDPQEAQRLIAAALPPVVASILEPAELEAMQQRLKQLPGPPARARLSKDDWLGALGVFLLVFVSTFPVVIPFIFMQNVGPALRVSNAIAIVLLFLTGYAFGRMTGRHPWVVGIAMVVSGRSRRHDHGAGRIVTCDCLPAWQSRSHS